MTTTPRAPRFVSAGEALTDLIRQQDGYWLARAGGAPWNVARVISALGIPSAFAGSVSRDNFGDEIATLSRESGLDMRFLQQHDKPSLLAIVHETSPPQYYFIGADSAGKTRSRQAQEPPEKLSHESPRIHLVTVWGRTAPTASAVTF